MRGWGKIKDELAREAQREFMRSDIGRLTAELNELSQSDNKYQERFLKTIERYGKFTPERYLNKLESLPYLGVGGSLLRYAKDFPNGFVKMLLNRLGPVGRFLSALASSPNPESALRRQLEVASDLIRAFGGEARLPWEAKTGDVLDISDRVDDYLFTEARPLATGTQGTLWQNGNVFRDVPTITVEPPTEEEQQAFLESLSPDRRAVTSPITEPPIDRLTPQIRRPSARGKIVMKEVVGETNVCSVGANFSTGDLYVRYYQFIPKVGKTKNPGPLYVYRNVPAELLKSIFSAASKGVWIWDNVRVRGTWSQHYYSYNLVGIDNSFYVPRKAVLAPDIYGQPHEWFVPRTFTRSSDRKQLKSEYGLSYAYSHIPDDGGVSLYNPPGTWRYPWQSTLWQGDRPDRATPDRGD